MNYWAYIFALLLEEGDSGAQQLMFSMSTEWEVLPGHPGCCGQIKGSWWESYHPGHWDGDGPAVHDGCHCWSWLLLRCGGTHAPPLCAGGTLWSWFLLCIFFAEYLTKKMNSCNRESRFCMIAALKTHSFLNTTVWFWCCRMSNNYNPAL